jgi:hypothetical protein
LLAERIDITKINLKKNYLRSRRVAVVLAELDGAVATDRRGQ